MQNLKTNNEFRKSQFLIASLFSLFLLIILEITWTIFYFWIPQIEEYFFEKELNILAKNYEEKINNKNINQNKDIERIKIWNYVVLLDKSNKNNFLVQKWWKNLWENLKKIVLKNKFSEINTDSKEDFSNKYFFSKSNLKEIFFAENSEIFTFNKDFFKKYELPKNFSWIKKFSLNWRKIFIFNKKIFIRSLGKEINYQAVIPSNIPDKALNTFIFYFQIIIFLISILSFFIYYFVSKKILEPIKISNEKIKKFSDNVWHEIMSPITIISWLAQLWEMGQKTDTKKILEATKKIENIVNTLKKISLLERENFQMEEKNLWELIKNFAKEKKISDAFLKIEKNIVKKIDENIFNLILENLYSNAIKYKTANSKIKIVLQKNQLIFENEVEKNISKNDLKKLKEKFFQADNSRQSKWIGLWLSIIDECLKVFWWKIKFFSEDKKFRVVIVF